MRRHPIVWSLLAAYLFVVGLWAPAATPAALVAAGAFTVLAQPPVLLAVLIGAGLVVALRHRPTPAPVKH